MWFISPSQSLPPSFSKNSASPVKPRAATPRLCRITPTSRSAVGIDQGTLPPSSCPRRQPLRRHSQNGSLKIPRSLQAHTTNPPHPTNPSSTQKPQISSHSLNTLSSSTSLHPAKRSLAHHQSVRPGHQCLSRWYPHRHPLQCYDARNKIPRRHWPPPVLF